VVRGLELFRDHFRAFSDQYVLIGGTACDLALTEAGLAFRATKDLDIVLCVEALDADFARAFWAFVKAGGYELHETAAGEKKFYRFRKPQRPEYPEVLELFSRVPDALQAAEESQLTPIPFDEEVSSLSAILLDDAYYAWIHAGKRELNGVPIVPPEYLIPLKATAWLDLRDRKASGQEVDSKSIKKHKNDVFRLFAVIDPEFRATIAPKIATDMRRFLEEVLDEPVDLKVFGLPGQTLDSVLAALRTMYGLGPVLPDPPA